MTRYQFFKSPKMKQIRNILRGCAIWCYISGVITGMMKIFYGYAYNALIENFLIIALGLLIHLLQSRVAAIILAVYTVINCIIMTFRMGELTAHYLILFGIFAVINTFKFQKAWKEYQQSPASNDILLSGVSSEGAASSIPYANSNRAYPTIEVIYQGTKRLAEIIDTDDVRNGDVIREHSNEGVQYMFSRVNVGRKYVTEDGIGIVEMCFEDGNCYKMNLFSKWERIIF